MIKRFHTKSRFLLSLFAILLAATSGFSQRLGIYEFTGHVCATPANQVTAQPSNAAFSALTSANVTCGTGTNIYNASAWNMTTTIDLAEYNQFTITPSACTILKLDSLQFFQQASGSSTLANWHVRSSLDGFAANVFTGSATLSPGTTHKIELPAEFDHLSAAVTFRFYITSISGAASTWRLDNVALFGTATTYPLANYYADADGDGFGNAAVFVNTCTPPAGYVANSTDCDDTNNAISSGITYYQDLDGDTFGNPAVTLTQCTAPVGYVTNANDCNDNNNAVGVATTIYYADADGDGFGNSAVTQTACTQPVGYVSNSNDCNDANNAISVATTIYYQDFDGDTYGNASVSQTACTQPVGYVTNSTDCNDANNTIHPGATETCDGIDNDCNGLTDDNVVTLTYYQDLDADGFGNQAVSVTNCSQPLGYVINDDDCDDNNNAVGVATVTYYADADGDGFGNAAVSQIACSQPAGYVTTSNDCDDNNNLTGIAANWYPDVDGDTYGSASAAAVVACVAPANHVASHTDCNDNSSTVYPGATEIPDNGIDEDCNGSDLNTTGTQLAQYTFTGNTCSTPAHAVTAQPANATFSDYMASDSVLCAIGADIFNYSGWNTSATVNSAEYISFTVTPADCYSLSLTRLAFLHRVSNVSVIPTIHVRSSLDNYAADFFSTQITAGGSNVNENIVLPAAFASITGPVTFRFYVTNITASTTTYRNDNVSVSGFINALPTQTYYADVDFDGFGDATATIISCEAPFGYVADNTDCDDTDSTEFPGAVWFQDFDGDTFGNPAVSLTQCTRPAGYVTNNTDCNDNNVAVIGETAYYVDADSDGFGAAGSTALMACSQPAGYSLNDDDCDDDDNTVTIPTIMWYPDADGDLYGAPGSTGILACTQPAGHAGNDDDCNDSNAAAYPGANEVCDGVDNDCDGQIDEGLTVTVWYEDNDGDTYGNSAESVSDCSQPAGYVANNTDCNDNNAAVHPGATDIANNGTDENCDGTDGYLSLDENAFGNVTVFPNPGTENLTIQISALVSGTKAQLISADGKLISEQSVTNNETVINTTAVLPGTYFVKIANASSSTVIRWIKK